MIRNNNSNNPTILILDDDENILQTLSTFITTLNYNVLVTSSLQESEELFSNNLIDVVLLDIRFPGESGLDYIRIFKARNPVVTIIIISGISDIETVIQAIKLGADDYLLKPIDFNRLTLALAKGLEVKQLREENIILKSQVSSAVKFKHLVGKTPIMREMYRYIEKFAPLDSTVFLVGETGTGKELVARTIHMLSPRATMKFITVNCGGIAESLLDSQLFGYEKGAFTGAYKKTSGYFEVADGGTIFLDEITETSNNFQIKLLRVLQEKTIQRVGGTESIPVNVRVIAATNRNFHDLMNPEVLRQDLFYRLNVLTISIPPLRQRLDDIPLLVNHFINKYNEIHNKKVKSVSSAVLEIFSQHDWKGNVRELENIIERAVALCENERITPELLPSHIQKSIQLIPKDTDIILSFNLARQHFEKQFFARLMRKSKNNVSKAAKIAGISRQYLHKKLKSYFPEGFRGK